MDGSSGDGHDDGASPMAAGEQVPQPDTVPPQADLSPHHAFILANLMIYRSLIMDNGDMVDGVWEYDGMMDDSAYGYIDHDDAYMDGGFGAVPASDKAIAGLAKAAVGETRETECVVCLESFQEGDKTRKMPCSHGFHESCIFKWLRVSRVCPHCRFELPAAHDEEGSLPAADDEGSLPANDDEEGSLPAAADNEGSDVEMETESEYDEHERHSVTEYEDGHEGHHGHYYVATFSVLFYYG